MFGHGTYGTQSKSTGRGPIGRALKSRVFFDSTAKQKNQPKSDPKKSNLQTMSLISEFSFPTKSSGLIQKRKRIENEDFEDQETAQINVSDHGHEKSNQNFQQSGSMREDSQPLKKIRRIESMPAVAPNQERLDEQFLTSMRYYDQKNYKQCRILLEKLASKQHDPSKYYLGTFISWGFAGTTFNHKLGIQMCEESAPSALKFFQKYVLLEEPFALFGVGRLVCFDPLPFCFYFFDSSAFFEKQNVLPWSWCPEKLGENNELPPNCL